MGNLLSNGANIPDTFLDGFESLFSVRAALPSGAVSEALLSSIAMFGGALLALMVVLKGIWILKNSISISDEIVPFIVEVGFVGVMLIPGVYQVVVRILLLPFDKVQQDIVAVVGVDRLMQIVRSAELLVVSLFTGVFGGGLLQGASTIMLIAAATSLIYLAVLFAIPVYLSLLVQFFVLIGPLAIPCLVSPQFRQIGLGWIRSMLATGLCYVVASASYTLIFLCPVFQEGLQAGLGGGDLVGVCIINLTMTVTLISCIPMSFGVFGGIRASFFGGAVSAGKVAARGAKGVASGGASEAVNAAVGALK